MHPEYSQRQSKARRCLWFHRPWLLTHLPGEQKNNSMHLFICNIEIKLDFDLHGDAGKQKYDKNILEYAARTRL